MDIKLTAKLQAYSKLSLAIPTVIDNLDSDSTTDSLSANQGKVLNDKITEVSDEIAITNDRLVNVELRVSDIQESLGGLRFGVDSEGNYGYYKDGADTITPFKS